MQAACKNARPKGRPGLHASADTPPVVPASSMEGRAVRAAVRKPARRLRAVTVARGPQGVACVVARGGGHHGSRSRGRARVGRARGAGGHLSAGGCACRVCRAHGPDPFRATHARHPVLHLARRSDRHAAARTDPRSGGPGRAGAPAARRSRHRVRARPDTLGAQLASEHRGTPVQPVRRAQPRNSSAL
ncbi:hypothetical protein QFZ96_000089 [Paraburkholderia youngii]